MCLMASQTSVSGMANLSNAWEVGASLLYLQPSLGGNGLGYSSYGSYAGADNWQVIRSTNGENRIYNVTPDWTTGFQIDGAYYFNDRNDVSINWYHLDETVDKNLPPSLFSGNLDGFYASRMHLGTRWDAVVIELAKHFRFSENKLVRLHTGVEFARIKNTFKSYPKVFTDAAPYLVVKDVLQYTGLGPRLGADFKYRVNQVWDLYAKFAGSVLVGTIKENLNGIRDYSNSIYGLIIFGNANYNFSQNYTVVPELDGKLGITYDYAFSQGKLTADLGYLWMNYLKSISSYTGIGIVASSVGIPTQTNFNLNGLYFNLTWKGM